MHSCDMWHVRLDFIWLCYMMVSAKECLDVWSGLLLHSPNSAQNPLNMDTIGCMQIGGITEFA